MTSEATARVQLEDRLAELKGRLAHLDADLSEPLNPDSSERAVEMEDDVPLEAQAELVTREIESVSRALDRLDKGTYGICVRCGVAVAPARLEARPEAALCIECAQ
ncbi:RNA polymerase-binding transcription factor DksA [Tsuneonella dongtanensis]|uniref:RNA polymerase-binding transcription factor DksA n=1 Tax=Tsuneonella dongtanensis TaxID=692370 RepID=A0A1B2AAL5_9SPHN|nr:TraR/DksA family transcriptional regulator [Tsuneonella dongtanensis]ANY19095.1 RNA polymerase-binding transcription factor DksA [Tsuneonella dongtanensis]